MREVRNFETDRVYWGVSLTHTRLILSSVAVVRPEERTRIARGLKIRVLMSEEVRIVIDKDD